jgi:hypothetical protein
MEVQGSLHCSQEPATGPYPEPDATNAYFPNLRSILISSSHQRLGLPSGILPSSYLTKICAHFSSQPCVHNDSPVF